MQVQINTDHNGREAVAGRITGLMEDVLRHVSDNVTRVEVHLSDENSDQKGGVGAMRCVIEARIEGRRHCRPATRPRRWTTRSWARLTNWRG